jgi:uncharacterized protein YukE
MELLSRENGGSAVAYASYIARIILHSTYDGRTYNGTHKAGLVICETMLPIHAPKAYQTLGTLWNDVERIEKGKKARLARTYNFALYVEFDRATRIRMARSYIKENFVDRGMCVSYAIHDSGVGNPHIHIITTTRSLDRHGNWMAKQQKNYLRDKDGRRIYDPKTKQYKCGPSIRINDWDDNNIEKLREAWAGACNREFERLKIKRRVTYLSYQRQGINREATKHLGPVLAAMERRGIQTARGDENRAIRFRNWMRNMEERLHRLTHMLRSCERTLESLREEWRPLQKHRQPTRKYRRISYVCKCGHAMLQWKMVETLNEKVLEVQRRHNERRYVHVHEYELELSRVL